MHSNKFSGINLFKQILGDEKYSVNLVNYCKLTF